MGTSTLAQRLRAAMTKRGLTPVSLAAAAQTTDATISNWLNDNVRSDHVKAIQLFKIADATGVSARELLLGVSGGHVAEPHAEYSSHPLQRDLLTLGIQLVSEVLAEADRTLPPEKQAEAVELAYDLLEEGLPRAKVLRFVRTAIAA